MKYVYILKSVQYPSKHYVGSTNDLKRRLKEHNSGHTTHTNKYKPWKLITYLAFDEPRKADKFEEYLKSGSGRTFAKNHF